MEDSTPSVLKFQLCSASEIVEFVKTKICEKEDDNDVDLTLISVLLGFIEHRLTTKTVRENKGAPLKLKSVPVEQQQQKANLESEENKTQEKIDSGTNETAAAVSEIEEFPEANSENILPLVDDFRQCILGAAKKIETDDGFTARQTIKDVTSAVLKRMNKSSHKEKPHFQSLYTFKNGAHLDGFGLTFAVVAGCQILGCKDVHLCLSEDHVWIAFGRDSSETSDINWHGKQNEVYRGESIDSGGVSSKSWLYMGGNPVLCRSRKMEATAAVAMMNPFIDNKNSSDVLTRLKRDLLWIMYDAKCMERYPVALCVLADLQENFPDQKRSDAGEIYHRAIECSQSHYDDNHVYPHKNYGSFLARKGEFTEALFRWQQAANVLRKYKFNREEEELCKQIKTIAHDLIPAAFKSIADSAPKLKTASTSKPKADEIDNPMMSFFENTENLSNLLLFYDGVGEWEQNGSTLIFQKTWAKPFARSVSYFSPETRASILYSPDAAAASAAASLPVVAAPLPRSPPKDQEAYYRSLVQTVLKVYGGRTSEETQKKLKEESGGTSDKDADEFVRACETSVLKADLVWRTEPKDADQGAAASSSKDWTPVDYRLPFRSRKMESLRNVLAKQATIRAVDVELQLCVRLETASDSAFDRRTRMKK